MKQILQQILASIKVTNIERYITEVERIREDIQARNFSVEDVDAMMELDNAKACEFMVLVSVCVCLSGNGVQMCVFLEVGFGCVSFWKWGLDGVEECQGLWDLCVTLGIFAWHWVLYMECHVKVFKDVSVVVDAEVYDLCVCVCVCVCACVHAREHARSPSLSFFILKQALSHS